MLHASATSVTSLSVWDIPTLLAKIIVEMMMVRTIISVEEDTTVEEAARIMANKVIECLPVMKGQRMVGFITKSDLFYLVRSIFLARFQASVTALPLLKSSTTRIN